MRRPSKVGLEDQLTTFERVFKIVPSLCGRRRRQEQSGQRKQKGESQNQHGMSSKTGRSYPQARQRHRGGECEREAAGQHPPQPPGPVAQHRCSIPSIVAVPSLDHVNTVSVCCSFVSRQAVGRSEVAQRRRRQRERRARGRAVGRTRRGRECALEALLRFKAIYSQSFN